MKLLIKVILEGIERGKIIEMKTCRTGVNLMEDAGYFRLMGINKKIKHILQRIICEGPISIIAKEEKSISREVEISNEEFKDLLEKLREWS
jgi:hypothetical protein